MPFIFISHSLRQILPRQELRKIDQRSGAYPTKVKTGDRGRTGKNNIYFDDCRTKLFENNVEITLPTTLRSDSNVSSDLVSSIGSVTGNVDPLAVDQFITHFDQSERLTPFDENCLFEQNEIAVVNSSFMTSSGYHVAPDKFKLKTSDKTAIRMEFPLSSVSTLSSDTSALYYLNKDTGKFDEVAQELSYNKKDGFKRILTDIAPLLFTPYGMHHLPLQNISFVDNIFNAYRYSVASTGDGSYALPLVDELGNSIDSSNQAGNYTTASLLNQRHQATGSQLVDMSNYISHPFLLEKITVEFPFQAGAGWLNDNFAVREIAQDDLTYTSDLGGPMITFALLRQDNTDQKFRDLIASGTITSITDITTGSYHVCAVDYTGLGGYRDNIANPEGLGYFINPSYVVDNTNTNIIKMDLDPQVTSHILRYKMSGSVANFAYSSMINQYENKPNTYKALGTSFSPINRRSSKYIDSSRNIYGNSFSLIQVQDINPEINPILAMDNQYEDGLQTENDPGAPPATIKSSKLYIDTVNKTQKNPYLLYPEDKLVLCLNKHRAVASDNNVDWDFNAEAGGQFGEPYAKPNALKAYHDVTIPTGLFKITLYGSLVKEDREFHDTLNQRLETNEIYEEIGHEPILDQFDVSYSNELSGSYIDRFNVKNTFGGNVPNLFSSSVVTDYYSNFSSQNDDLSNWSSEFGWSRARSINQLKKNTRNVNHISTNEKFWDSRVPDPIECAKICNPSFRVVSYVSGSTIGSPSQRAIVGFTMYTGNRLYMNDANTLISSSNITGTGIRDWMMTYPFEGRYKNVSQKFSNVLNKEFVKYEDPNSYVMSLSNGFLSYDVFSIEMGASGSFRLTGCEDDPNDYSVNKIGLSKPEFFKVFYGIGDGISNIDNQHATFLTKTKRVISQGAVIRGWKYGLVSAFPTKSSAIYRRDKFGQPRDMLEQRLDAKYFDEFGLLSSGFESGIVSLKDSPVQIKFYDNVGNLTEAIKTLSCNLSMEATSSVPYFDGLARNRIDDYSDANILSVVL